MGWNKLIHRYRAMVQRINEMSLVRQHLVLHWQAKPASAASHLSRPEPQATPWAWGWQQQPLRALTIGRHTSHVHDSRSCSAVPLCPRQPKTRAAGSGRNAGLGQCSRKQLLALAPEGRRQRGVLPRLAGRRHLAVCQVRAALALQLSCKAPATRNDTVKGRWPAGTREGWGPATVARGLCVSCRRQAQSTQRAHNSRPAGGHTWAVPGTSGSAAGRAARSVHEGQPLTCRCGKDRGGGALRNRLHERRCRMRGRADEEKNGGLMDAGEPHAMSHGSRACRLRRCQRCPGRSGAGQRRRRVGTERALLPAGPDAARTASCTGAPARSPCHAVSSAKPAHLPAH